MKEFKKPEVTGNKKLMCEEIWRFTYGVNRKKYEIEQHIYPNTKPNSHERQIRDMLSILSKHVPIIATSDQDGYMVACTSEHVELAKHQLNELRKRKLELELRERPLEKFIQKHEIGQIDISEISK